MAFGFEFQQPTKEYKPKQEMLVDTSVIVAFNEQGDIKPLRLIIEAQEERYVYNIPKIYYKSFYDIGGVESIRFGIRLKEEESISRELIYFIEEHQWKIKL